MLKKIVLVSIILILSSVLFSAQAQDNGESDAPYIYYYSSEDKALIIERADGTDKQILSRFELPESATDKRGDYIIGPGWSPSGEWFAWGTDSFYKPYFDYKVGNQNGSIEYGFSAPIRWWLNEDWLFIHYNYSYPSIDTSPVNSKTVLFDVNKGKVIWTLPEDIGIIWTPQGKPYTYKLIDDTIYQIMFFENFELQDTIIYSYGRSWFDSIPSWSPKDDLLYLSTPNRIMLWNFEQGDFISFDLPTDVTIARIEWNITGSHALIFLTTSGDPDGTMQVLLLSVEEETLKPLLDNPIYAYYISVNPLIETPTWSPDGTKAIFYSDDGTLVFDLTSNTVKTLSAEVADYMPNVWVDDTSVIFANFGDTSTSVMNYDVGSNEIKNSFVLEGYSEQNTREFTVSSDKKYVTVPVEPVSYILDLETNNVIEVAVEIAPELVIGIDEAYWYPDSHWVFLVSNSWLETKFIFVFNPDTGVLRSLTKCLSNRPSACFGWLPEERN